MNISEFKYTIVSKNGYASPKLVETKNIQKSYRKPALRHMMEYNSSIKDWLKRNNNSVRGFRDVSYARELVIDLDIKKGWNFTALCNNTYLSLGSIFTDYGLREEDLQIYFSGDDGLHIHIPTRLFSLKPCKKLSERVKLFVHKLCDDLEFAEHIDWSLYQPLQHVRLPFSPHDDTSCYKIPIPFNRLNNLPLHVIRRDAANPDLANITKPKVILKENTKLAALWNEILLTRLPKKKQDQSVHGVEEGLRHNETLRIIRLFRAQGLTQNETIDKMLAWDKTNSPSLNEHGWIAGRVVDWYNKTKHWDEDKLILFIDPFAPLLHILNHPALNVSDSRLLGHLFYNVNSIKKKWEFIYVMPGSAVFTLNGLAASTGLTKHAVRTSIKKLTEFGLIKKMMLKKKDKVWGLYLSLGSLLRNIKLEKEYSIDDLELPRTTPLSGDWGSLPRYINIEDIGDRGWDESDERACELDAV